MFVVAVSIWIVRVFVGRGLGRGAGFVIVIFFVGKVNEV